MKEFRCTCGKVYVFSDLNRCPYCHKDMVNQTDGYVMAHLRSCSKCLNPYIYSDKPRGRPPKKAKEQELANRAFRKHCRNCGTRCSGCEEGICERWSPKILSRCHFCGLIPSLENTGDTWSIICDECRLSMSDTDRDALISRWNCD